MPPILILDTNVLVAGLRSARGASFAMLKAVGTDVFEIGLTATLVFEYESVLKGLGTAPLTPDEVDEFLDYLCGVAHCAAVRYRVRPTAPDAGDDLVLEAAVATASDWIVSHNIRHFADGARQYGIELTTPGEALKRLGITT